MKELFINYNDAYKLTSANGKELLGTKKTLKHSDLVSFHKKIQCSVA